MRKTGLILGGLLGVLAVAALLGATTNPGYFRSLIVAGGAFVVEDDGTVTATLGSASTVDDAALSANVAHLNVAETITGNWVNTANPWADNEVSDSITVGSGGNLAAPPAIGGTTPNTGAFTTLGASGSVTFTGSGGNGVASSAAIPSFRLYESDQSADSRIWRWLANGTVMYLTAQDDALTKGTMGLRMTRSGTTVTGITLDATATAATGTLSSTGTATAPRLVASATAPYLETYETDAASNAKRVRFHNESGVFHMAFWDDAAENSNSFITATRSGYTVTGIAAHGPLSTSSTNDIEAGGDIVFGGHLRDGSSGVPTVKEKQTNVVASTITGSRDTRGKLSISASGGNIAPGKICRVVFNAAMGSAPYVVLGSNQGNSSDQSFQWSTAAESTTGFDVYCQDGLVDDEGNDELVVTWIAIE